MSSESEAKDLSSTYQNVRAQLQLELNPKKMRRLVREFGQFPTEHRQIIWRYLLNLPQNTPAFRQMVHDVPLTELPKSWRNWLTENKSISKTIHTYMTRMLRWLAAWSPELSVLSFVPEFILPFVRTFRTDYMTCFELLTTVIFNWGRYWLVVSPLPPFDLMCLTEKLLQKFGPGSLNILKENKVNVTSYAWPLLEHGFAGVLGADDWAQLWDHLLAHSPALMFAAIVAYVATTESSLKSWIAETGDAKGFYNEVHKVDMRQFLRKAYEIFDSVNNWPNHLLQPLTVLPQGVYLSQIELEKLGESTKQAASRKPQQPKKQDTQSKSKKSLTMNKNWESFEMREQWLQEKETAMAQPGIFSVPGQK